MKLEYPFHGKSLLAFVLFSFVVCALQENRAAAEEGLKGDSVSVKQPLVLPQMGSQDKGDIPNEFRVRPNVPPPGGSMGRKKLVPSAFEIRRNVAPPGGPITNRTTMPLSQDMVEKSLPQQKTIPR